MTVAVVVNPTKLDDPTRDRRRLTQLLAEHGADDVLWLPTTAEDPGPGQTAAALTAQASLVLAWGGDGTVTAVAGGLRDTGVPLGILPGGTGNLLARNLDLPLDLAAAVRTALTGRDRPVDMLDVYLGQGEHRPCTVMCGTGWDADMMDVGEELKRRLGWGAYALAGARRIRSTPMRLRLSVDGGHPERLYGRTVLVANVGTLVAGLRLLPEAAPDDGLLEVLVVDPSSPVDWLRTTAGVLRGRGSEDDPSRTVFRGREVVVTTGHRRRRQIDGDLVRDGYGFRVTVLPQALLVRTAR